MTTSELSSPSQVMAALQAIGRDAATRQNDYERAAQEWARAKRDRERAYAEAFMRASGTVEERRQRALIETATEGVEAEALFEGLKAVMRVLELRASVGQSILRAQGRS